MAVGLTGGTTCTEVARELVDRERLTVVTNALNIASELAVRPNLKLVVTGGTARPESYELVGPLAEQSLAGLHLDLVVIGVDGIDAQAGCTTHHEVEAHTDLALIERAERVVVVADSSKIGHVAFARICPVDRVAPTDHRPRRERARPACAPRRRRGRRRGMSELHDLPLRDFRPRADGAPRADASCPNGRPSRSSTRTTTSGGG